MQNKNQKTKLRILIALVLVFLGISAYSLSGGSLLQGLYPSATDTVPDRVLTTSVEDSTAEQAANQAETRASNAATYEETAHQGFLDAKQAYGDFDQAALTEAQADAENAATYAETAADYAQQYADHAQDLVEQAEEDMNDALESVCRVESCSDPAPVYNSDGDLVGYSSACTYEYSTTDSEYLACVEVLESGSEYESEYLTGSIGEGHYAYDYYYARQIYEETLAYAEAAAQSADEAATSAAAARVYANAAAEYSLLSCQSLTLSPSSYEMAEDDTTASFDLTATVADSNNATSSWLNTEKILSNMLAFTLVELNTDVVVSGTLPALSTGPTDPYWQGNLVFSSDLVGNFSDGTSAGNPFTVALTEEGSSTVSFTEGQEGETITVYVEGEETLCSSSFTITQAARVNQRDPNDLHQLEDLDTDTDADGLTDAEEEDIYGTDSTDADSDDDGLTDGDEVLTYGTDPLDEDSDSDGLLDGEEVLTYGTDPLDEDSDDDELTDGEEVLTYGTDPLDDDSDDDTYLDGEEISEETDPQDANDYPIDTAVQAEILSSTTYDCSDPFTDMTSHWAQDMVCRLFQAGIVNGRTNLTFVPDDYITRGEWIKVLDLIFGHTVDEADGLESDFLDVQDWYRPYVIIAEKVTDTIRTRDMGAYFYPNENITRGDAILYAIRMADKTDYDYDIELLFSDVQNEDYFAYALAIATETTVTDPETGDLIPIVEGYTDGTFRPDDYISRSEAMAIAIRVAIAFGVASEGFEDYAAADQ